MSSVNATSRRASDRDIIKLNSVGLSLGTIGKKLGCHSTTITSRLKSLNIEPADTRRSFMEDVYNALTPHQQEWLANQVGPTRTIKDLVRDLLVQEYIVQGQPAKAA